MKKALIFLILNHKSISVIIVSGSAQFQKQHEINEKLNVSLSTCYAPSY